MKDQLTLQEIFTAYEKFCIRTGCAVEDNLAYFADTVIHIMNVKLAAKQRSCRWARESVISNMAFRGVVLVNTYELDYIDMNINDASAFFAEADHGNAGGSQNSNSFCIITTARPTEADDAHNPTVVAVPATEDHTIAASPESAAEETDVDDRTSDEKNQEDDKRVLDIPTEIMELTEEQRHVPGGPWTDVMKKTYIGIADKFGIKATAAFYGLSAKSAQRYLSQFKDDLGVERDKKTRPWSKDEKMKFLKFYEKNGATETAKKYGVTTHHACCKASTIRQEFNMPRKRAPKKSKNTN